MTAMGSTETERLTIAEAQRQGKDQIEVMFNGHPTPMCGVCGRIVCHLDCPRWRRGSTVKQETTDE